MADGRDERLHHVAKRLPLGQRGSDEGRQGPQSLRLRVSTARSRRAIKPCLDLLLKYVKQGTIVLGCSQQAVGDGDQRDMPIYRLKVPDLILLESISFALFVIDFNGPAVASDARNPLGLTVQLVGHQEHGGIRKVGLSVVDDQAWFPKVMDAMGVTVTVIGLAFTFVTNRNFVKDGCCTVFERFMVLFLQLQSQYIQALCA
jgi:hypothetical protein